MPGETYFNAAKRETLEECNIDINNSKEIVELGLFSYLANKDLYLFAVIIEYVPVLQCNSFYEEHGKIHPEMVDFKWIEFDEYAKYLNFKLIEVFDGVLPLIKSHIYKQK